MHIAFYNKMFKLVLNKNVCPFLENPFDDCYCVKLSSQDIERAVYLCSKSYELCDVYKKTNGRKPLRARKC